MSYLWKELHQRALKNQGEDESHYLHNFASRIPRYVTGCKCKEFYSNWVRTNPATYGKNGEFFAWTVKLHNAVNQKLNKPQYTVEQAKKFYSS